MVKKECPNLPFSRREIYTLINSGAHPYELNALVPRESLHVSKANRLKIEWHIMYCKFITHRKIPNDLRYLLNYMNIFDSLCIYIRVNYSNGP